MIKPKVSVIVPVYNAEEYLHRCIDSILAQTFTDFELLLINDGSTDESGLICDEYASKDNRVRVFHKENGGVTSARALGVNNSQSDWITFVDADDKLCINALLCFISKTDKDVDIIVGFHKPMKVSSERMNIDKYQSNCIAGAGIEPWGKLFRRNLFSSSVFDIPSEIRMGEDWLMNVRLSFKTSKSVEILLQPCNVVYNYIENENQTTKHFKHTINYEELFLKYLILSIPNAKINYFLNSICKARMYSLRMLLLQSNQLSLKKTENYKFLLSNWRKAGFGIKQYIALLCYKTSFTQYLLYIYSRRHKP